MNSNATASPKTMDNREFEQAITQNKGSDEQPLLYQHHNDKSQRVGSDGK